MFIARFMAGVMVTSALLTNFTAAYSAEVGFQSRPRPTITRAVDIIEKPADRIDVGTRLTFKPQQTQQASRIRRQGFQIRVFTLGLNEAIPEPISVIDDCNIYVSAVYLIHSGNSSEIVFEQMDESWLGISNSGRTVFNGRYLFVFEIPEGGSGAGETVFRLHKDDSKSYFETGFRLTVEAGRADVERVKAANKGRDGEFVELYKEINKRGRTIPCYRYLRYVDATPQYAQGTLAAC